MGGWTGWQSSVEMVSPATCALSTMPSLQQRTSSTTLPVAGSKDFEKALENTKPVEVGG